MKVKKVIVLDDSERTALGEAINVISKISDASGVLEEDVFIALRNEYNDNGGDLGTEVYL